MKLLETNLFASLHNGKNIFFSHISLCKKTFAEIEKLDHNVILITGNDDIPVGEFKDTNVPENYQEINDIFNNVPKNVKYWFAQNNITKRENIIPIPLGLRNSSYYLREDHEPYYEWASEQNQLLKNVFLNDNSTPDKFLYVNYCNRPNHRDTVKNICKQYLNISFQDPGLGYSNYVSNILDHECVMCPIGVGVDTYRLYETLYCKRIPITVKVGKYNEFYSHLDELSWTGTTYAPPQEKEYPIYTDLYSQLPIVMLESLEQLKNIDYLKKCVEEQRNKQWNREILDFSYWEKIIVDASKSL